MKLIDIKKDLMNLQGKYFGVYDATPYKEDSICIQFVDFLEKNCEEVNPFKDGYDLEDWVFERWDEEDCEDIEEISSENSYNWNSPVIFQYREFRYNDEVYTGVAFHRYGDVRGNYTGYAIFKMNCESFLNTICEFACYIPCKNSDWNIVQYVLDESGVVNAYNHITQEGYRGYYESDGCPVEVKEAVEEWM